MLKGKTKKNKKKNGKKVQKPISNKSNENLITP
jgi:hypothetical protein